MHRILFLLALAIILSPTSLTAQGLVKDTWPNGSVKSEGILIDGMNHSTWEYHNEEGRLSAEVYYDYGDDTLRTDYEYNTYGELYSKLITKHGVKNEFWEHVTPKKTIYTAYHPNGKIKLSGQYKSAKEDGKWEEFDESGELIFKYEYSKGELQSKTVGEKVPFGVSKSKAREILTEGMIGTDIPLFPDIDGMRFDDLGRIKRFVAGEVYLEGDTLHGYIYLNKAWEIKFAASSEGEVDVMNASEVKGFKVDELVYISYHFKYKVAAHPYIFLEVVNEDWLYPIYARTMFVKNLGGYSDFFPAPLLLNVIERKALAWTRTYFIASTRKNGEQKLEAVYAKNKFGDTSKIMGKQRLAKLLVEKCPLLARGFTISGSYKVDQLFKFVKLCPSD